MPDKWILNNSSIMLYVAFITVVSIRGVQTCVFSVCILFHMQKTCTVKRYVWSPWVSKTVKISATEASILLQFSILVSQTCFDFGLVQVSNNLALYFAGEIGLLIYEQPPIGIILSKLRSGLVFLQHLSTWLGSATYSCIFTWESSKGRTLR
jgi:hypothetical protein